MRREEVLMFGTGIATCLALLAFARAATAAEITVTPLIHASVQIEVGNQVIQGDPWSAGDLTRAKKADLILVSDDPGHHLDPKAIRELKKPDGTVIVPAASHAKFPECMSVADA